MKCPKCSYVSHDYLNACRKCRTDLVAFKRKFKLMALQPGALDLGALLDVGRDGMAERDRFSVEEITSDMPPSVSLMTNGLSRNVPMAKSPGVEAGLDGTAGEIEIDIHLDTDKPNTSAEPGELTKTFYVPEELARQLSDVTLPFRATELNEMAGEIEIDMSFDTDKPEPLAEKTTDRSATAPDEPVPVANPESSVSKAPPPVPAIDLSVGDLDDYFDDLDAIHLDTSEIDHDIDLALYIPSTVEIESPFDTDTAEKHRAEMTPDIASPQERPFDSAALMDNLADNTPGLELREEADDVQALSEERHADTATDRISPPDVREDGDKANDVGQAT